MVSFEYVDFWTKIVIFRTQTSCWVKSKYSINFIDEIHRHTFENLGNSVEALNIDNNRLGALREEVFLPLTNLKSLQVNTRMNFQF